MVYGLPHAEIILGKVVKPDWPLTLEQAAKFVGYRLKRARTHLDTLPAFSTHRRELLDGKRKAELARNLATAIAIRDDEGENLAADRTVRLKATGDRGQRGEGRRRRQRQPNQQHSYDHAGIRHPTACQIFRDRSASRRARARAAYDRRKPLTKKGGPQAAPMQSSGAALVYVMALLDLRSPSTTRLGPKQGVFLKPRPRWLFDKKRSTASGIYLKSYRKALF
jgi:hypothetical protein